MKRLTHLCLILLLATASFGQAKINWKDPIDWRRTAWMNQLEDFAQTVSFHHLNERPNFNPIYDRNPLLASFVKHGNSVAIAGYFLVTGVMLDRLIMSVRGRWAREALFMAWSAVEIAATLHNRKYIKFSIPIFIMRFNSK